MFASRAPQPPHFKSGVEHALGAASLGLLRHHRMPDRTSLVTPGGSLTQERGRESIAK